MKLNMRLAQLYGWTVAHVAGRYQLRNPAGIPVGALFRAPLAAWKVCPNFLDDREGMLRYARNKYGHASMFRGDDPDIVFIKIGQRVVSAEMNEVSETLAKFLLGLEERAENDAKRAAVSEA